MKLIPDDILLVVVGIAVFAVMGFLYQVAVLMRNDRVEHDLKIRVVRLRAEQAIKVRDLIAAAQAGMKKAEAKEKRGH